jgi:hypothetical protein
MRGKCLCGQVEFEISGAVPKLYQCHCSLCQKQGGSTSNTATIVTTENFKWLAGQEHISSWVKDTGFRSDFCSRCGSPVPNRLRSTSHFWVPAGLFNSGAELEVVAHLFVDSKASWDTIASSGVKYQTMPELSEFLELLHSNGYA